jgi:hypothetical protein
MRLPWNGSILLSCCFACQDGWVDWLALKYGFGALGSWS